MINYEVGQVVYLLSQKTLNIVPALIVEEVTRKTVTDSTTEYVIEMPNEKGTRAKLSAVTSMVFSDITRLRDHMLDNTRKSVEKLISDAVSLKDVKFGENYIDNRIFESKSENISESLEKNEINKKDVEEDNVENKNEKLMQNDVKGVIMNGNIDSNNT